MICGCIAEKNMEDALKVVKSVDVELFEHRMDYMENLTDKDFKTLYTSVQKPFVATNRSIHCGGHFEGSEDERIALLLTAIEAGASYVDIEVETEAVLKKKVIEKAHDMGCKVIISMHDFDKTPALSELIDILHQQKNEGADIGKIVTTATKMEDCDVIYALLDEAKQEDFTLVAFAMGELAKKTRVIALKLGSPFTFASITKATAPGQIDVKTLQTLMEEIKKKGVIEK